MDTRFETLLDALHKLENVSNEQWVGSLDARKLSELKFADKGRNRQSLAKIKKDKDLYEKYHGNKKYYEGVSASRKYTEDWIANNVKDKIFLDYACGNGGNAILAAKAGAKLAIGIDISRVSINNCKEDAEKSGVSTNTFFVQSDAENTQLPDASIDVVICSGMLHHLDLSYAFPELRRIMANGAKILAIEALCYNPIISLYRKLTPNLRTDWEKKHILGLADLDFA